MRGVFLFTLCVMIVMSCHSKAKEMPIDENKLINILVDVHVAEAAMQEYASPKKDSIGKVYYQEIFSLHHVTEEAFIKSMYLLRQDPEEMETVYKAVVAELERREKEVKPDM